MQRARYLMRRLAEVPGVRVPCAASPHFQEFVVNLDGTGRSAASTAAALLRRGIFAGHDLSRAFPELGQSLLVCVSEVHTQADLDTYVSALREVLK
jgi:glycine dehydrogenase subunit 1